MSSEDNLSIRLRWARFRFSVIGPLLADPPEHGELQQRLTLLAKKSWRHPINGEKKRIGESTIERWFYTAKNHPQDPINALARKVPSHTGSFPSLTDSVRQVLRTQYRQHSRWSYKLHYDNLKVLCDNNPELSPLPSYQTICRFMKTEAMHRKKQRKRGKKNGQTDVEFERREVRSYEAEYVNSLWHLDFHEGSHRILLPDGEWVKPLLLGVLDDHSRLCCHLQWYLEENTEALIHGLCQAFLKRAIPAALMTDNGKPMTAAETSEGLLRLGVVHETTLPYSPEQNGKQENFWAQVEGRLMAMLEGEKQLTLSLLNQATQAWVEMEYHREPHSEIGTTPLQRYLDNKNVGRPSPDAETLQHTFRKQERRTQRRSDGTLTVKGVRFEIPSRYRTLLHPCVRFARWDLSSVDLVDERTDKLLCVLLPLDKHKNADGRRRVCHPLHEQQREPEPVGIAPLLQKHMADYAATGRPPAYLPYHKTPMSNHLTDNGDNDEKEE